MQGAPLVNLLTFWALPSLLSAFQLFSFGTWLPHRHGEPGFADAHNARSNGFGPLLSLLTCFHFGRHHEHHLYPYLPAIRRRAAAIMKAGLLEPRLSTAERVYRSGMRGITWIVTVAVAAP